MSDQVVIAVMSVAFFGQGMVNLGWTLITDVAPKRLIGLTGGVFNLFANLAGIITPIVIGVIVATTGSFFFALAYIAVVAIIGALSYIFIVGEVKPVEMDDLAQSRGVRGAPAPTAPGMFTVEKKSIRFTSKRRVVISSPNSMNSCVRTVNFGGFTSVRRWIARARERHQHIGHLIRAARDRTPSRPACDGCGCKHPASARRTALRWCDKHRPSRD